MELFDVLLASALNGKSSGGSAADPNKPVKFFDYDGTLVYSYTPEEFAELSALPANPSHDGLTAQGWNWSLSDAKTYVAKYGALNVGQMYITDDGKTRIYITLSEGRISPVLSVYLNANSELDIDWGDGTAHSTFTSTTADYKSERHNYAAPGDYVIAIEAVQGSLEIKSGSSYCTFLLTNGYDPNNYELFDGYESYSCSINKINLGNNIQSLGNRAFYNSQHLEFVSIPQNIISFGKYAASFTAAKAYIIPNSTTSIDEYCFYQANGAIAIALPNRPFTYGNGVFTNCYVLTSLTIPEGAVFSKSSTTIGTCYNLKLLIIPNDITTFPGLEHLDSIRQITIPNSVTSINTLRYTSVRSITVPNGVTKIPTDAFYYSQSLMTIEIPDSVTEIGGYAFQRCYALSSIIIPDGVSTINSETFDRCFSLGFIKFKRLTPPIVVNSNAFNRLPTECKILVPRGTLAAYKSATNYPNPSTYTYEEYDVT